MTYLTRLVGPLLARELVRLARGPILRLALIAAPCFLLLQMVADGRVRTPEKSMGRAAQASHEFVGQTFLLAGVVLALALPLWICPTIVRERSEGGFDLILTTQLTLIEALLGVAGASIVVSGSVLASIAPVVSVMGLFGGVDPYFVLASVFTIALEVACITGGCLNAAVVYRTPLRATLVGALQGLAAFLMLALVASPAFFSFEGAKGGPILKSIGFAIVALIFFGFAAGIFYVWIESAAAAFTRDEQPIAPTRRHVAEVDDSSARSPDVKRSAMWGPLKLRLDDSAPTRFQIRAVWFLYLGIGSPICWLVRSGEGATVAPLLLLLWIGIQPFVIAVAATNPLLGRRPGFFDDLLATDIPHQEILAGVVWIVQPALIRLLAAPLGLALLWIALNPAGNVVGAFLGVAWTAELLIVGVLISLVDNRLGTRLLGVTSFWAATVAAPIIAGFFMTPDLPMLLLAVPPLGLVAWFVGLRMSAGRAVLFCLAIHFALICVGGWAGALCQTKAPNSDVLSLLSPLYWLRYGLWESVRMEKTPFAPLAALPFALSVAMSAFLMYRFTLSSFDRLVGRTHPSRRWRIEPSRA